MVNLTRSWGLTQMELYNHTRIPNKILEPVLYHAAKNVGSVRTGNVVVVAIEKREVSHARQAAFVYEWFASQWRKPKNKDRAYGRSIRTDGGYVTLHMDPLRFDHPHYDPLAFAESLYSTMAHEWQHIKDFQKGKRFGDYNRNWANRPHERRAVTAQNRAVRNIEKRDGCADAILDLGIFIESQKKKVA